MTFTDHVDFWDRPNAVDVHSHIHCDRVTWNHKFIIFPKSYYLWLIIDQDAIIVN